MFYHQIALEIRPTGFSSGPTIPYCFRTASDIGLATLSTLPGRIYGGPEVAPPQDSAFVKRVQLLGDEEAISTGMHMQR